MGTQAGIDNITISKIRRMSSDNDEIGIYKNLCIVNSNVSVSELDRYDAMRIEAMMFILCTSGTITCSCNMHDYTIEADSIFICPPGSIVKCGDVKDGKFAIVFISPGSGHINPKLLKLIPKFINKQNHGYFKIPHKECLEILSVIKILQQMIMSDSDNIFYDETCESFLQALHYKSLSVISKTLDFDDEPFIRMPRKEELFQQFMKLLAENYRQERSIKFYANRMCITPKYLGVVIKEITQKNANQIIDECVIAETKNLLTYSTLSIQQIAQQLNFSDQSFFGKYFKKHTGLSPLEFRKN